MAGPLRIGEIWAGTVAALRGQFWTLFWIAAPFTLMVDMTVAIFGPAPPQPPKTMPTTFEMYFALYPPALLLLRVALPLLAGGIAQLAVARLIAAPANAPRDALAAALKGFPAYAVTVIVVTAAVIGGASLLLLPGIYVWARLFLCAPIAAIEGGSPLSQLARSWQLTAGQGARLFVALLLGMLVALGLLTICQIAGVAVGSILATMGLKAVGDFAVLLFGSTGEIVVWLGATAAATTIYARLRPVAS